MNSRPPRESAGSAAPASAPLVLNRAQVRDVDRRAIEDFSLPGVVLMENAGRGAAEVLLRRQITGPVAICAGKGNNGGDGFVIARHLALHHVPCAVHLFCAPQEVRGDAAVFLQVLQRSPIPLRIWSTGFTTSELTAALSQADWIVDALLGTGTQGTLREPYLSAIAAINAAGKPVLAVDLPSGLDCDTGATLGDCVRAACTVTFVAEKPAFQMAATRQYTGHVEVVEIGFPTPWWRTA